MTKQIIGDPLVINGRRLSLSRAVRAGDFVFLTGQVPMQNGAVMTHGSIEDQTRGA
jgi:2-iminobutanoate/2-iminopropanoate deaminase